MFILGQASFAITTGRNGCCYWGIYDFEVSIKDLPPKPAVTPWPGSYTLHLWVGGRGWGGSWG